MIAAVQHKQPELAPLCRKYGVRRLELFGSAATGSEFDPIHRDLDVFVEIGPSGDMEPADRNFGLWDVLTSLFARDFVIDDIRGWSERTELAVTPRLG
jgi:hypothetical protein